MFARLIFIVSSRRTITIYLYLLTSPNFILVSFQNHISRQFNVRNLSFAVHSTSTWYLKKMNTFLNYHSYPKLNSLVFNKVKLRDRERETKKVHSENIPTRLRASIVQSALSCRCCCCCCWPCILYSSCCLFCCIFIRATAYD